MNKSTKFSLLGAAMALIVLSWFSLTGVNKSQFCEHKEHKTVGVKIKDIGKVDTEDARRKMQPDPKTTFACYGDDIEFEGVNMKSEFEILFKPGKSPFKEKNLKSNNGRVKAKVAIDPSRRHGAVFIDYDIKATDYELHDPKIIIRPH